MFHAFQKGNCTFGDRCKYSHEVNGRSSTRETNGSTPALIGTSTAADYDAFVRWRYDIPRTPADIKKAKPLHHRFARFIQTALDLVEAGAETMQEVIACLASPAGVPRLSELLDANMSQMDHGSLLEFWKERLLPYLQLLAHENVLTSGIIEVQHATLLTYTYSINGKRAQAVFQSAVRCLTMDDEIPASIEPTLVVLAAMFEAVPTAQVNDALRGTAETLIALATDRKLSGFPHTQHTRLCLRLGLGGLIQQADPKKRNAKTAVKPTFVVTVHQPGDLSTLGQRHDNDSEDIDDIQILPTMDEISSDRSEYLPQDDPASWHKLGVDGLLDRHFRLLREDTVGQLRDAAKFELQRLQNPHTRQSKPRNGARTHSYHNVRLAMVEFDSHKGLLCVLAFEQPHEVRNKSMKQRQDWWNECKRLENETLLGLLGSDGLVIFVTVVAAVAQRSGGKDQPEAQRPLEERYTKWCEQEAHVIVQLVNQDESNIESMLIGFGQHSGSQSGESSEHRFSLIEFPGIILPAFQPTLQGLQRMSRSGFLPFSNLLAPGADTSGHENEPPAYARRIGFRYDLSVLSENDQSIELDPHEPISAAELCQQTRLDHGQAQALITSLTCGLALIQGPPRTGKSYTGVALTKVLLANREAAKLGPIVIVTFTNHALDQNLEHLLTAGVKQIIRIGSRSKSELLGPINLRIVAQGYEATKPEKREKWQALKDMRRLTTVVTTSLRHLWHSRSMQGVEAYLKSHYFKQYQQLCEDLVDDEGFTKVTYRPKGVHEWLNGHARGPQLPDDLSTWTQAKRHEGFATWLSASSSESERDVMVNLQAYDIARAAYNRNNGEIDLRALNDAHVIGVTTSGLARNLHVLSRLKAKVLIVEEAGEVLEAHLLTAMLPSIEHAILIGDHQQLRPKVANYDFSCENRGSNIKLDISLFERLIQPQQAGATPLPYAKLDVQRRMHPSISRLIRTTLYPELKDDASVEKYPQVCGMRRRLFWLQHSAPEEGQQVHTGAPDLFAPPATNGPQATTVAAADSTSHTNQYEVDMVFTLVRHLIWQGVYRPSDIAVLTPYLGQLRRLRRSLSSFTEIVLNGRDVDELNKDGEHDDDQIKATEEVQLRMPVLKSTLLKAIRLGTVDNFQGEEAKVVIISLVRSNDLRRCGFLRTPNRINVLLSRAQHGMYVIGNPETASGVNMWQDVIQMLQKDGNMGPSFELSCARHPDTVLTATTPDEFTIVAPEAGCNLMILACGHQCPSICGAPCPPATYCQHCATDEVKGMRADFYEMTEYGDVDLATTPCIFTPCGHVYTVDSLDGVMGMAQHYSLEPLTGMSTELASNSQPFSGLEMKNCPDCRGSLRSMARYGRIIRRALLDESTKRFMVWSARTFHELSAVLQDVQAKLLETRAASTLGDGNVLLMSNGNGRFQRLKSIGSTRRYRDLAELRRQGHEFWRKAKTDDQPFARVYDMVETVRRQRKLNQDFVNTCSFDDTVLQTRWELLASALVIRCDMIAMIDLITVWDNDHKTKLQVNFSADRRDCEQLVARANATKNIAQETEAHVFWATFAALECQVFEANGAPADTVQRLRDAADVHIGAATDLCDTFPGQTSRIKGEVDDAKRMLHEAGYKSQLKMVVAAMGSEFRGTGHWYICVNGHPFVIGECGMAMELARCPDCNEQVGGTDHVAVAGVQHADQLERDMARLRV
ncbi:hypothetical protein B0A48_01516 [Cryoendolithus antarcticus]|uniref:Uncharacterized protein n=1 Tax=Cryoendolithus antarcticus TaxID=1507870 RepID=A0A1V8TPW2_9PEZI|nr:hypothetical protein B0A48_01516 [Cryoendolithus antarcticus]